MTSEQTAKAPRTPRGAPLLDPALVDEYAEVRQRVLAWKPNVNPDAKRYAELHEQILAAAAPKPAEEGVVLEGKLWRVPVSPQENESTIKSIPALQKRLGLKWFLENAKITLAAVRKAIPKEKLGLYILTERTGAREVQEPVRK